ncbi:MAG TPA: phosphotransferase family protein [Solirubrobacteraceae bacterium]|nr:phosphotransferase family protein [Solirubrobacteraceae bacterium]
MLEAELRAVLPDLTDIRSLRRLTGGASRETWAFDDGDRPLIYRRGAGVGREAVAMQAAARAGVPEPRVIAFSKDWAVMERVEGETIARRILRDERFIAGRSLLAEQCGEALARIHSIALDAIPGLAARDALDELRAMIATFDDAAPGLELGLRWLGENRPPPCDDVVLHGDFRLGNLVVSERGIEAVLDWELVHRGDPMQDLGYLCVRAWRFGGEPPVGGFGQYEELFAAYERASGRTVDPRAVRWWELFGTVWWGGACMMQAARHLSGGERSVELAAIGRRVWEQEYDVLLALA